MGGEIASSSALIKADRGRADLSAGIDSRISLDEQGERLKTVYNPGRNLWTVALCAQVSSHQTPPDARASKPCPTSHLLRTATPLPFPPPTPSSRRSSNASATANGR